MRTALGLAVLVMSTAACRTLHEEGIPLLDPKTNEPAPGDEITLAVFENDADLAKWKSSAGKWVVESSRAVGTQQGPDYAYLTWPVYYGSISSVTVRGGIRSAGNRNFRVAVGHVTTILNWEMRETNVFHSGRIREEVGTPALSPGTDHEIRFIQEGEVVRVYVDGRELWSTRTRLTGTVTVYPAVGSTIEVMSVVIRGRRVPWIPVNGPSQPAP